MSVAFTKRLVTPPHVLTRLVDEELVLLNLDTECYFGLDEVSTRIWEVLASSPSIEASLSQLVSEFDVEPERLRCDIEAFLEQLLDNGLVELPDV